MKLLILVYLATLLNATDILYNPINQSLGRDNDPKVVEDISKFQLWNRKAIWSTFSLPGMRFMANLIFPKSTIVYFDTDEKIVAFTIDDGFCGKNNVGGDMLEDVLELFDKYDAVTKEVVAKEILATVHLGSDGHVKDAIPSKGHEKQALKYFKAIYDAEVLAEHGPYQKFYNPHVGNVLYDQFVMAIKNNPEK